MNQTQVQVFRLLLRNIQASLVDLAYVFHCKGSDETEIVSLVKSIDLTLLNLLSTSDYTLKLDFTKKYFESDYPKLNQVKTKYKTEFQNNIQQFRSDFRTFLEAKALELHVSLSPEDASTKFRELSVFDEPFNNVLSLPFPIEEFIMHFTTIIPFEKSDVRLFLNRGVHYISFFNFLRQLAIVDDYKVHIDDGDIPSEVLQTFQTAQSQDEEKASLNNSNQTNAKSNLALKKTPSGPKGNVMPLQKSKNGTVQLKWGLIKIEAEPLLHEKDSKPSRLHQGTLSLNGLLPANQTLSVNNQSNNQSPLKTQQKLNQLKLQPQKQQQMPPGSENIAQPTSPRPMPQPKNELNQYDQMIEQLETDKKQLHDWNEIIVARLEQKALLLQKENQILRENIDIVTKQKMEVQQLFEDHLAELFRQNEFLKTENSRLKENDSTLQSDDDDDTLL